MFHAAYAHHSCFFFFSLHPNGLPFLPQVSVKGRASAVSLLQMATYSGLCVLVRLQAFRGGQQPFPLSFIEVLRDPHILKVGVGCYEDGKRLTRDYGLSLSCTVDLRYLALRQRYRWAASQLL